MPTRIRPRRRASFVRDTLVAVGAGLLGTLVLGGVAEAHSVRVPFETPVVLQVSAPVSSGAVHVGTRVPLIVAEDVVVDGYLVIRQGAEAEAVVENVQGAGSGGAPGAVSLRCEWVRAVDRSRLGLTGTQAGNGGYRNDSYSSSEPLGATSNIAYQTGLYGVGSALSRISGLAQTVGVRARGREAVIDTRRSIGATIRTPGGVVVTSTWRVAPGSHDDPIK